MDYVEGGGLLDPEAPAWFAAWALATEAGDKRALLRAPLSRNGLLAALLLTEFVPLREALAKEANAALRALLARR